MSPDLVHTFPSAEEIVAALARWRPGAYDEKEMYPLIAEQLTGQEKVPNGAVVAVVMGLHEYCAKQPPMVSVTSILLVPLILRALLPEGPFLDEALAVAHAAGIGI